MAKSQWEPKELNQMHLRFVEEYLVDLDGTAAVTRAGYKTKNPAVASSKLLTYSKIQQEIKARGAVTSRKTDLSREKVLEELKLVAFADFSVFYDKKGKILTVDKMSKEAKHLLASVTVKELTNGFGTKIGESVKFQPWDKLRALELIAKILGFMSPQQKQIGFDETFMNFLKKTSGVSIQVEDIPFEEQQ